MRKVGGNCSATLSFLESCKDQLLEAEEITLLSAFLSQLPLQEHPFTMTP